MDYWEASGCNVSPWERVGLTPSAKSHGMLSIQQVSHLASGVGRIGLQHPLAPAGGMTTGYELRGRERSEGQVSYKIQVGQHSRR